MTDYTNARNSEERRSALWFRALVPVLVLVAGFFLARYIMASKPRAARKPPPKMAALVQVETVRAASERILVTAMGTVVPAREIDLTPQVNGEIVYIHPDFQPGSTVKAGTELLRIDPTDYELAVTRKASLVAQREYELKLELGRQTVARREWELVNKGGKATALEKELALRKPHLDNAKAALAAAKAEFEEAKLDLERTRITAPFNAVVLEKFTDLGAFVTAPTRLAVLVGADEYWVQVAVPVDRLSRVSIPNADGEDGSKVRICVAGTDCGPEAQRTGQVIRLLGDLEEQGRMARLLVRVEDPHGLNADADTADRKPLLINDYVRTEIEGEVLENVYRIPRFALRDGGSVWLAGPEDTLEIRDVTVAWGDETSVLISEGLSDGDSVIVSDLATPVPGIPLTINRPDASTAETSPDNETG